MITKMKKISFLVLNREYQNFLERLRELGVVHVVERQKGAVSDAVLQEDMRLLSRYQTVLKALGSVAGDTAVPVVAAGLEAEAVADRYEAVISEKERLEQQMQTLLKERQELSVWGDFEMDSVRRLSEAGYEVRFFCCPPKAFDRDWEKLYNAIEINSDRQRIYFITVTPAGTAISVDAEPCGLPEMSLSCIGAALQEIGARKDALAAELQDLASKGVPVLRRKVRNCSEAVSFDKVSLSGESVAADSVVLLDGWIPAANVGNVAPALESMPVFFDISNPTPDDEIPVLLDNNRFARLFEPLTKLYMLPTYQELDLTLIFAPFFMLFFGLCLGDIGYGLLMIVALPVFTKLFQLINPDFSKWLVVLFGASTMLCGLLSGSFFGFNLYDLNIPFVSDMKELLYRENSEMFNISLYIGVFQILVGMAVKAVNQSIQMGVKYAVGTLGWLLLLLTVIAAVLFKLEFGNPVIMALLCIAGAGIFLFNSPGKNPLLNIGLGLWDTYNMATGLLGDVLSYVRLFALGLSGGILANVFNSMAVGMSPDVPVLNFVVTALIFIIGHALNIFMNILGAVVHPMRLTFVEFFKNAGYTGGGMEYKPFRNEEEHAVGVNN